MITCVIQSLQEYEKVLDVFSITLMRSQAEVEVNIIVTYKTHYDQALLLNLMLCIASIYIL